MFTIHDIMEYIKFDSISENIEVTIAFADSQPSIMILTEIKNGDTIFEYAPKLREKYSGKYNTEAVIVIVEEILEDVAREYREQTSLIHAIELGEEKFKDKRNG